MQGTLARLLPLCPTHAELPTVDPLPTGCAAPGGTGRRLAAQIDQLRNTSCERLRRCR